MQFVDAKYPQFVTIYLEFVTRLIERWDTSGHIPGPGVIWSFQGVQQKKKKIAVHNHI